MNHTIKKILFVTLLLLMLMPLLQQITRYFNETELKGAYVKPEPPEFSIASVASLDFQQKTDAYQNFNFGFRSFLVRLTNSINYLLFKDIAVEDQIEGKNGFIYSVGSIKRNITGDAYNGKQKNENTITQLKYIENIIREQGGQLMVLLAPSKESIMPENLPSRYDGVTQKEGDYEDFISYMKKYKVPFIDFNAYFKKIKTSSPYPLFTKTGFHWSVYGASLAQDSLVNALENLVSYLIPHSIRTGIELSDTAKWSDADFEPQMNLLFSLQDHKYVYPKLTIDKATINNQKPKAIIIGDSFFWQIKNLKQLQYILSADSKFLYYFKTSFPLSDVAGSDMKDIDVMSEIGSADVVILIASLGTLGEFPYGFSDYYLSNRYMGSILNGIKSGLKNTSSRFETIATEAKERNIQPELLINLKSKSIFNSGLKFYIKAYNGKYVCADAANSDLLFANRNEASGWETFTVINFDDGKSSIYSSLNKFLCAELNGQNEITATRKSIGNWESFNIVQLGDSTIALRASNGKYIKVDSKSLQLFATSESIGAAEKFKLESIRKN